MRQRRTPPGQPEAAAKEKEENNVKYTDPWNNNFWSFVLHRKTTSYFFIIYE